MEEALLRQIIKESIREVVNEGIIDTIVKQFDNVDDFVDKLKQKHPDTVLKSIEIIKKTGGKTGNILKQKGIEGLNYLKEKNTPERRKNILNWVKKNQSLLLKGGAVSIVYNNLTDVFGGDSMLSLDDQGLKFEFIMLLISVIIVMKIINFVKDINPFSKNENTEAEEIDFNVPINLTSLLDSPE